MSGFFSSKAQKFRFQPGVPNDCHEALLPRSGKVVAKPRPAWLDCVHVDSLKKIVQEHIS